MSNRIVSSARTVGLGLSLVLLLVAGPANAAENVPATVRVVTWQGEVLLDKKLKTGSTTVKTSRKAGCLGGSPSNGRRQIPGATALGILQQASEKAKQIRPLLLSNAFDFGLGVCGIGDAVAGGEQWWVLKHNHASASAGGEGTVLERNDVALWYLSESYNQATPSELYLKAPGVVKKKKSTRVRVLAYDDAGKRRPVKAAKIRGTNARPTDSRGYTTIRLKKKSRLIARSSGLIPSNRAVVKVKR
jgi:hypothetical protein